MDTPLWYDLNHQAFLKCYKGKISPVPVRDPVTKKLLRGPLINKTDSGPDRLASQAGSAEFSSEMADIGMHILLSLPNGTECTAKLDQMYTEYKRDCKKSTVRVAGIKMAARVQARKKSKQRQEQEKTPVQALKEFVSLDNTDDDEEESTTDDYEFQVGRSVCSVNIPNRNLGAIVNGSPGDHLDLRPFDKCFTIAKILNTWIVVGLCL